MEIKSVLKRIVEMADPYKIILFGSYARGTVTPDSDIDLMILLDNDFLPKTSSEKLERNWNIHKLVLDINYQYAMDVKIYSRAEFRKLKNKGSFFIEEIEKTGKTIYEN
ncbi:MAG: nucleotidyltransferase domain-containing protein [Endomicrobium sp.]|jgi:predicted nucleotidyltransferase|nr:nucleotidyltransferase domain-containing protein [Endomicrobium sp.]